MATAENTQLTAAAGYDANTRMIFSEPISGSVPDTKIEFKRINISSRNDDGSVGELILQTERLFSFGVSENVSQDTGKVTGYTFPLCMWTRDAPTTAEKAWTNTFDLIVGACVEHVMENKEEIELHELTRSELTKSKGGLNPMYWKKEKVKDEVSGKTVVRNVKGVGPTLYAKLIFSKKNDKFLTQFFDMSDEPMNALDLMGKYCFTNAAVKIESIFISGTGKVSLQVKLYEAVVEPSTSGMKRLLARPKAKSKVLAAQTASATAILDDPPGEMSDEAGSLVGSDNEPEPEPEPKLVKKKTVRRVKKAA